jgi:hypothetical protein
MNKGVLESHDPTYLLRSHLEFCTLLSWQTLSADFVHSKNARCNLKILASSPCLCTEKGEGTKCTKHCKYRLHIYSRTQFIRINWVGEPYGYAEIPDIRIFFESALHWQFASSAVTIYNTYLRLNLSTTRDLKS